MFKTFQHFSNHHFTHTKVIFTQLCKSSIYTLPMTLNNAQKHNHQLVSTTHGSQYVKHLKTSFLGVLKHPTFLVNDLNILNTFSSLKFVQDECRHTPKTHGPRGFHTHPICSQKSSKNHVQLCFQITFNMCQHISKQDP